VALAKLKRERSYSAANAQPLQPDQKRRYIEGLNRFVSKRKLLGFPIRLSDTEIITMALDRAASAIRREED
jgi:hypothetical protein